MICSLKDHAPETCSGEVKLREAMTQYHFEGEANSPEDPNRDFLACEAHWERYEEHWSAMWADYHGIIADNMRQGLADMEAERRAARDEARYEMEQAAYEREIEEERYRERQERERYEGGDW